MVRDCSLGPRGCQRPRHHRGAAGSPADSAGGRWHAGRWHLPYWP